MCHGDTRNPRFAATLLVRSQFTMAGYDFRSPRLYVEAPLAEGADVALDQAQAHYLGTVLRLKPGSRVLVFNGRDGEWGATVASAKRVAALTVDAKTRPQTTPADLHYLFAPLKAARLDYMVQKAVEMGVSRLQPVLTRHSQVARVNMRAHAGERHRSRRAMRHPFAAGYRRTGHLGAAPRRARARSAIGILR